MHFTDKSIYEKIRVKYVVPMTVKEVETEKNKTVFKDLQTISVKRSLTEQEQHHFRKTKSP